MRLEDYFEFLAPNDIRVKGTRVGIETILSDYLDLGLFPEDIALRYPTLSLESVYATITYYWHNQDQVEAYLQTWREHGRRMRREQELKPPPGVQRLRAVLRERQPETYLQASSEP
jgi:uncharacterized protein (DUF433 family)